MGGLVPELVRLPNTMEEDLHRAAEAHLRHTKDVPVQGLSVNVVEYHPLKPILTI